MCELKTQFKITFKLKIQLSNIFRIKLSNIFNSNTGCYYILSVKFQIKLTWFFQKTIINPITSSRRVHPNNN